MKTRAPWFEAPLRQDEIDRGEVAARTARQLASAVRQNSLGAWIDADTAITLFDRRDRDGFVATVQRLLHHLEGIEDKCAKALLEAADSQSQAGE